MFVALIVIIHTMLRLLAKYVLSRNLSSRQVNRGAADEDALKREANYICRR